MPKFYSATFLQSVTKPGRYRVEPGLYLSVSGTTGSAKTWTFRYQRHGQRHDAGLGAFPDVSVTEAKRLAVLARQQLGTGLDPIQERKPHSAGRCQLRRSLKWPPWCWTRSDILTSMPRTATVLGCCWAPSIADHF